MYNIDKSFTFFFDPRFDMSKVEVWHIRLDATNESAEYGLENRKMMHVAVMCNMCLYGILCIPHWDLKGSSNSQIYTEFCLTFRSIQSECASRVPYTV